MGSFLEKDIDWTHETMRMDRFLDKLEKMMNCAVPESERDKKDIKQIRGHIKHFRELFTE